MTDKEKTLFDDWKNRNKDKIEDVVITLLNYEKGVDTKTCYDEIDWLIQKAYLAGLNANRPKWHYLRKTQNDLPKHSYYVLVHTDEGIGFGVYGLDDNKWHTYNTGFDVIAWCEIPKFEEDK